MMREKLVAEDKAELVFKVDKDLTEGAALYKNVQQGVIIVTEDKAELVLNKHLDSVKVRQQWVTPFGVFLSLLVAVVVSDFKDFILSGAAWQVLFLAGTLASGGWLFRSGIIAYRTRSLSIKQVIELLKKSDAPG